MQRFRVDLKTFLGLAMPKAIPSGNPVSGPRPHQL